jgi:TusA-related sulfurtransferase
LGCRLFRHSHLPGEHHDLVIAFDCTQATDSIPHWAAAAGYPVTNFEQVGAFWAITVQKA